MVQEDLHRSPVLYSFGNTGKTKDTRWSCFVQPLRVFVQGGDRMAFFPCSGNGNGSSWNNRGGNGNYWSSSLNSATNGRNLSFYSGGVNPQNNNNRFNGFVGRAVQHSFLNILFNILYSLDDTDETAVATGVIHCLLRCSQGKGRTLLCPQVGKQSEREHGVALRRFVLSTLQSFTIEMLHSGLSEEARDICSHVQRQNSTSPVLQHDAQNVREDFHTGHIQLHQGSWYALWYWSYYGLLSQGEPQLAEKVLCYALGYSRLLHAHRQKETAGDSNDITETDGNTSYQQSLFSEMGRRNRYGLRMLSYGDYRYVRSSYKLHCSWFAGWMDWSRPSQVDAQSGRRVRSSYRKSHVTTILECVYERIRPIYEASLEVSLLWSLRGRCGSSQLQQGVAIIPRSSNSSVPEIGIRIRAAHGQTGNIGGTSWRGIPRSIHKALAHLCIKSFIGSYREEGLCLRLFKALEGIAERQQLSRHLTAYGIAQYCASPVYEIGNTSYRCVQCRYD